MRILDYCNSLNNKFLRKKISLNYKKIRDIKNKLFKKNQQNLF